MRPPDIVPDVNDDKLREIYGAEADEIIAFRRFLALPSSEPSDAFPRGQKLCPPHWHDYGTGKIGAAEALRLDNKKGTD